MKQEAIREREFRAALEKRSEDIQLSAHNESSSLQQELSVHQKKIHFLQQEVNQLTIERDQLFQKMSHSNN